MRFNLKKKSIFWIYHVFRQTYKQIHPPDYLVSTEKIFYVCYIKNGCILRVIIIEFCDKSRSMIQTEATVKPISVSVSFTKRTSTVYWKQPCFSLRIYRDLGLKDFFGSFVALMLRKLVPSWCMNITNTKPTTCSTVKLNYINSTRHGYGNKIREKIQPRNSYHINLYLETKKNREVLINSLNWLLSFMSSFPFF